MKKLIALLLVAVMALGLVACGAEETPATTAAPTAAPTEAPAVAEPPLDVLTNIWNNVPDEKPFFIMGGDYEAMVSDAPGLVTLEDFKTGNLLIPAEQLANLAEVACMTHAMNVNNFTCGAYKLTEGADAAAFVEAVKTNILGNQWMCGFPELLLAADVNGVVVIMFGLNDAITPVKTALTGAYPNAQILVEEPIA